MWFAIAVIALVVVAALVLARRRSARRRGALAFGELSREDQVQAMRNREVGGAHRGSRENTKGQAASAHLRERFGPP